MKTRLTAQNDWAEIIFIVFLISYKTINGLKSLLCFEFNSLKVERADDGSSYDCVYIYGIIYYFC